MKRREFLTAALAAAAATKLRAAAESTPSFAFPTQPRERLAVSTYPFRNVIASPRPRKGHPMKPGMRLEEFAATVKQKFDVSGIEPWGPHFESTDPEYVAKLNAAFRQAGLHVVDVPVDAAVHLCSGPEQREAGLGVLQKWVDAAVTLGSPSVRVHLPPGKVDDISCPVESLRALAQYGASKNIVVNVENDDPDGEQPERIVQVLKTVNSPYLRSLPDFCNSMLIHDDQSYNEQALSTLFPLAFNISHVKDSEAGDGGKIYRVDIDKIFAIAKRAGYRGFFSMEFEGTGDPYEGTSKLIAASLRNLS